MFASRKKAGAPKKTRVRLESYLDRLYMESRCTFFRILLGEMSSNPLEAEILEKIRVLIEDDEHLEDCRRRLGEYFPGRIARMFNLAGENDQLFPLEQLRISIRAHVERRVKDLDGYGLDETDLQALEELKKSSKLQQQLAYLVNYTPGKWLLEQERPAIEESRRKRLKDRKAGVLQTAVPAAATPAAPGGSDPPAPSEDCAPGFARGSDPYEWSRDTARLRGLCLSGGGIRSATFNLGVLQGLAKKDLLRHFDYLSSVSGGGYIHQWLAAWIKREEDRAAAIGKTGLDVVCEQLLPLPDQGCAHFPPEPIKWLRRYSNYLTPQTGLFGADLWVTVAIWMRNMLLNQIVLISGLFAILLIPHLLIMRNVSRNLNSTAVAASAGGCTYHFVWFQALVLIGVTVVYMLPVVRLAVGFRAARLPAGRGDGITNLDLCLLVVLPFLIASIAISDFSFYFTMPGMCGDQQTLAICGFTFFGLMVLNLALTWAGGALYKTTSAPAELPGSVRAAKAPSPKPRLSLSRTLGFSLAAALSASIGAGCMYLLREAAIAHLPYLRYNVPITEATVHWRLVVTFGPLVVVIVSFIGVVLHCGLVGKAFDDSSLEWLGRARAWITMYSLVWTGWMGISVFGFDIVRWITFKGYGWVKWPVIGSWVLTTAASVLMGKSGSTGGDRESQPPSKTMAILTLLGPPVYIAGLLLLIAWAASLELHWAYQQPHPNIALLGVVLVPFLIFALFGWRVDVNEFSMHSYYRNRLTRCYLGASNLERNPDPLTGFDRGDVKGMQVSQFQPSAGYSGPLPIFCATLNISVGEDLAWQERKAASFAFSPVLSGYYVPWTGDHYRGQLSYNGFVPSDRFAADPGGIHISTAAAISGAAVSPDAGYHTSPPMAFLLTMFNVRLGWWMENPRRSQLAFDPLGTPDKCLHSTPRFAPLQLVQELLGRIGDDRKFVYLTDGGHFDNMGLYELVRRRCYEIVICDAEQDEGPVFEGIGMAIRKCRIDFGVEIELDLNKLATDAATGLSKVHWITGSIRYPETGKAAPGTILYIKSSITGQEAADVYNYRLQHTVFPQDSTTDQWFTESQFESYRRLGQQVVDQCPYL